MGWFLMELPIQLRQLQVDLYSVLLNGVPLMPLSSTMGTIVAAEATSLQQQQQHQHQQLLPLQLQVDAVALLVVFTTSLAMLVLVAFQLLLVLCRPSYTPCGFLTGCLGALLFLVYLWRQCL
jgi:hypothetical protein